MSGQMVGVGDGHRKRVRGIRTRDLRTRKQPRDHRMDLRLFGIAISDGGFLDQPGGIFADRDSGTSSDHQDHAPCLAELERRLRILVDEHFLDRRAFRLALGNQGFELERKVGEPLRQRRRAVRLELTVGEVRQPVAFGGDQPPAGGAEARVEAENPHGSPCMNIPE